MCVLLFQQRYRGVSDRDEETGCDVIRRAPTRCAARPAQPSARDAGSTASALPLRSDLAIRPCLSDRSEQDRRPRRTRQRRLFCHAFQYPAVSFLGVRSSVCIASPQRISAQRFRPVIHEERYKCIHRREKLTSISIRLLPFHVPRSDTVTSTCGEPLPLRMRIERRADTRAEHHADPRNRMRIVQECERRTRAAGSPRRSGPSSMRCRPARPTRNRR